MIQWWEQWWDTNEDAKNEKSLNLGQSSLGKKFMTGRSKKSGVKKKATMDVLAQDFFNLKILKWNAKAGNRTLKKK